MNFYKLTASGLGTGYAPVAPGTAGATLGTVLFYLFHLVLIKFHVSWFLILVFQLAAVLLVLTWGTYCIKKVHLEWNHDAQTIVIDEIAGVWIASLALPFHWTYYLYALILFRIFDIFKPLFIRRIDNLKTDWSVMLDDVVAGIYALIALHLLLFFNVLS